MIFHQTSSINNIRKRYYDGNLRLPRCPMIRKYGLLIASGTRGILCPQEQVYRRLGGVVVSVLATGPKRCGFKTRPRLWIFKGDKIPQHTLLSDGK
jgi:hypothetical protein